MELTRDLFLITHFIGLALIVGPFVGRMRAHSGYMFGVVFTGSLLSLVSGLALTWLAEVRLGAVDDMSLDHTKIGVKLVIGLVIVTVALIGYLKQRKLGSEVSHRKLLPLLHTAGALAIADIAVAVLWPGVVAG
jgi:hypothetical protein